MDTKEVKREYSNGEVTIIWRPGLCMHASYCREELPEVFNTGNRPWINLEGAAIERIIEQVKRCPSQALSYQMEKEMESVEKQNESRETEIKVITGGPLLVCGKLKITDAAGETLAHDGSTALCRCGASKNKPYCDGTHQTVDLRE